MHHTKLLQILRLSKPGQENKSLPSYTEASKTPSVPKEIRKMASKTPQWKWSTHECHEWLRAVYVVYFNYSLDEADAAAKKFEGFGPNLYLLTPQGWITLLGDKGAGLRAMLIGLRHKRGAVPSQVKLN